MTLVTSGPARRTPPWSPVVAVLVAAAFLAGCGAYVRAALDRISEQNALFPGAVTRRIEGPHVLTDTFVARASRVGKLYLFVMPDQVARAQDERVRFELADAAAGVTLARVDRRVGDITFVGRAALALAPGWTLQPGHRYRLRVSLPDAAPGHGLSFGTSVAGTDARDGLSVDDRPQPGLELDHLLLGAAPSFPWAPVLAGAALAGLLVAARALTRWPAVLLVTGVAVTLSEYAWERALWVFWGEFWPDLYVYFAREIFEWLSGRATFGQTVGLVAAQRSGTAFVVPLAVAVLHWLGLSYLHAYVFLSAVFSLATLVVLDWLGGRLWRLTPEQRVLLLFWAGLNLVVVRGFARPVTDAAGACFATLFVAAVAVWQEEPRWTGPAPVTATAALVLGILTRLALLPLLLVPPALVAWRRLGLRRGWAGAASLLAVSIVGAGLLALTFTALGSWLSAVAQRACAARPEFTSLFSVRAFGGTVALGLQLLIPLGLLHARRLVTDDAVAVPVLAILGIEAMLFVGRIIPWVRYQAPVAPLACGIAAALLFRATPRPGGWRLALLAAIVAANVGVVALKAGY